MAEDASHALKLLQNNAIDLILLDVRLPKIDGIELLKRVKKIDKDMMVIMITAVQETRTAVEAMKLGAYDYISKPFDYDELCLLVKKALEQKVLLKENLFLHSELARISEYDELIGESPEMKQVNRLINRAAQSDSAVLILGESGTGKELIARAIHNQSERKDAPFVAINCAAIPDSLLESELFGHESGAFTGAAERKLGKFETADGGTIFLDEIGSMSLGLQAKMLRVLQEKRDGTKEFERLGSSKSISVDVLVISATNKNLSRLVEEGKFREDLYYRLNVIPIEAPPLRKRKKDIPLLLDHFLEKANRRNNKNIPGFDRDSMDILTSYSWPGNVRELKNLVEREVVLKQSGVISMEDLPIEMLINKDVEQQAPKGQKSSLGFAEIPEALEHMEKQLIIKSLKNTRGNQVKAAKMLGIHRNTLSAKLKILGINKFLDRMDAGGLSQAA